ncbi:MAG: MmgE/PrpD family protein [Acidimicrobiia bacterium]
MTLATPTSGRPVPDAASFVADLAERTAATRAADLPPTVLVRARHSLLDCLGTMLGGHAEPVAQGVLRAELAEPGPPRATVVGSTHRLSTRQAALANGAAAHALDYDDNCAWMLGHPSAPTVPAVLALAEREDATLDDAVVALVAGLDAGARIGLALTTHHYDAGWHGTGTVGTMAAAAACARLLGLDPGRTAEAVELAASHATGLKAVFGTMGKPLNAAKAALNGLLAAEMAAAGVTARAGILAGPGGFGALTEGRFDPARPDEVLGDRHGIEGVTYKFHASCAGTHPTIDGIERLRREHGWEPGEVTAIEVSVPAPLLSVCNIAVPTSGLEGKFSLAFTAGLAAEGRPTGPATFVDEVVAEPRLRELVGATTVTAGPDDHTHGVRVALRDGTSRTTTGGFEEPVPDDGLDDQWARLATKFAQLAGPVLGAGPADALIAALGGPDGRTPVRAVLDLTRPAAGPGAADAQGR